MEYHLIKNAKIVNRGQIIEGDILVKGDRIEKVAPSISHPEAEITNVRGNFVIPGIIDDQVHFREPGLTHKANIATESRAAAAGGVTSFMEMPNTKPSCLNQELLQAKYDRASETAMVNYSFFMGASNDNIEEVLKTDRKTVCGVKVFMGSSTGNMLVDDRQTLDQLFSKVDMLIATHCEDEQTVRNNVAKAKELNQNSAIYHPIIRDVEACYKSSSMAIELAKKHGTRLHILHISTAKELELFRNDIPMKDKRITSEVCVHHLFFDDAYYHALGNKVKCNPAIKSASDREALIAALKDGRLDVIATDHAPHTVEEKAKPYFDAPSGLPLVQHSLTLILDYYHKGTFSLEFIIDKMCHKVADMFDIADRGYIDEGKKADLVIVDANKSWTITKDNVYYKCGWSPIEGFDMKGKVISTMCNGQWVYKDEQYTNVLAGQRLQFAR